MKGEDPSSPASSDVAPTELDDDSDVIIVEDLQEPTVALEPLHILDCEDICTGQDVTPQRSCRPRWKRIVFARNSDARPVQEDAETPDKFIQGDTDTAEILIRGDADTPDELKQAIPKQRQMSLLSWFPGQQHKVAKRPRLAIALEGGTLAAAISRRQERRARNADLRAGDMQLPPPVVGYDIDIERNAVSTCVRSLDVKLPMAPLAAQCQVMDAAIQAMEASGIALLESPTGTGKTLALLGCALAYQRTCCWAWEMSGQTLPSAPAIKNFKAEKASKAEPVAGRASEPPRVVWVARTHDQLQHAIAELRRLPYRPLEALRISRERFCLHPFVQHAPDKSTACEMATMTRHGTALGGGISGCEHLDNAEAIGYPNYPIHRSKFESAGELAVHDIEDLIAEGQATHTCPYHAALDLTAEGAGLVFATYPQVFDPVVRGTSSFDAVIEGAIVIVDEAHNVPQVAREAGTFRITAASLKKLLSSIGGLASATSERDALQLADRVCLALSRLGTWLDDVVRGGSSGPALHEVGNSTELQDLSGQGCLTLVSEVAGLQDAAEVGRLLRLLRVLRRRFIEHGLEGWAVRSSAVNDIDSFLRKMELVMREGGRGGYVLMVRKPRPGEGMDAAALAMVSLTAEVAFQAALGPGTARAVLLASGTLAPFGLLKQELGLVREQALVPVVTAEVGQNDGLRERLRVIAVGSIHGHRLNSTQSYRQKHLSGYLEASGRVLASLLPAIPNGTLVFFPSHQQLQDALCHWRTSGLLHNETLGTRPVVVGGEGSDPSAATTRYRKLAVTASGAVLLTVMRGRCAEGSDFRDEAARAVAIVGVPYPGLDTEVRLKLDYECREGAGRAWYEAEAYRSVSQAAGRLLRHQHDYGCLLLLDERFSRKPPQQLSAWLRGELDSATWRGNIEDSELKVVAAELRSFFVAKSKISKGNLERPSSACSAVSSQQHVDVF